MIVYLLPFTLGLQWIGEIEGWQLQIVVNDAREVSIVRFDCRCRYN